MSKKHKKKTRKVALPAKLKKRIKQKKQQQNHQKKESDPNRRRMNNTKGEGVRDQQGKSEQQQPEHESSTNDNP